jgi:hypothetical protein
MTCACQLTGLATPAQGPGNCLATDRICLGATPPSPHRQRGGVDDMTFHAVGLQAAVHPEAATLGFADRDHLNGAVGPRRTDVLATPPVSPCWMSKDRTGQRDIRVRPCIIEFRL